LLAVSISSSVSGSLGISLLLLLLPYGRLPPIGSFVLDLIKSIWTNEQEKAPLTWRRNGNDSGLAVKPSAKSEPKPTDAQTRTVRPWPRIRTRFRIDQKRIHDRSRTDEKFETLSSPRALL
jgi:hypothetical protein